MSDGNASDTTATTTSTAASHPPAATTASASDPVDQALYDALKLRLLRSGEWARLQGVLRRRLDEAGWGDDVRDVARERIRADPNQRFIILQQHVAQYGQKAMPETVKNDIMQLLLAFLEQNVRDPDA